MKWTLRHIGLLVFILGAYVLLPVMNGDYLYTIQDNNVFISGHTFMMDTVGHEGGWLVWMARYLTQFFYYPWLGSTILFAFWVAIYWVAIRMFGLKGKWSLLALTIPAFLLYDLLSYGYWIYYAKAPGFPFVPTFLALFSLLFTWGIICLTRNISDWRFKGLIGISLLVVILYVGHLLWPASWRLCYHHRHAITTTLTDKNFRREMRLYRALDEFRFDDALKEATTDSESPTRLVMLYRNIALMQTGQLQQLFHYDNHAVAPYANEDLQVHVSQLGGALIYYHFGQVNYAYRRAMESVAKYGLSFRNLKMMARCAILNREYDVAMKYLTLLRASTFHRQWALERERWLMSGAKDAQSTEYQAIAPLLDDGQNLLDNDEGLCEKYLMEHFCGLVHPQTPMQEELAVCTSLQMKDVYAFCMHFYDHVHTRPDAPVPLLYQEGAILLATGEESPITLGDFRFDALVSDRFNRFVQDYNQLSQMNLSEEEMGKRLCHSMATPTGGTIIFATNSRSTNRMAASIHAFQTP